LGEDVGRSGLGGADHMGVHAEGDRGVGMAQAGGDHMHRHTGQQQGRGVDVPQVVQRRVRQLILRARPVLGLVMGADELVISVVTVSG
jgi:hypothetical protein